MLTAEERMELDILRKHGAGVRELARATGHSRNTVRRYLREGEAAVVRKRGPKRAEKLGCARSGRGARPDPGDGVAS